MTHRRLLLIACSLYCLACGPVPEAPLGAPVAVTSCADAGVQTTEDAPAPPRVVTVWISPEWTPHFYSEISQELVLLSFGLRMEFRPAEFTVAQIRVRPYHVMRPCGAWGGHRVIDRVALIDPSCARDEQAVRAMAGHLIGHLLGMDDLDPLGGPAMMHPLAEDDRWPLTLPEAYYDVPTPRDVAELARTREVE